MPTTFRRNVISPGEFNNYDIAGTITNAFALGEIGSTDDFFLVGLEPEENSIYPMLTGNILDSEGNLLFQLRDNIIKINPGHCSKILGNIIGYEIHDSAGKLIFKVETVFKEIAGLGETFVTTIKANFYNKAGELVFMANSGEPDEMISSNTKTLFGANQNILGISINYSGDELELLKFIFSNRNAVAEPVRGVIEKQDFELNGKLLINATIRYCKVTVSGGDFGAIGPIQFYNNSVEFKGVADNIYQFIRVSGILSNQRPSN